MKRPHIDHEKEVACGDKPSTTTESLVGRTGLGPQHPVLGGASVAWMRPLIRLFYYTRTAAFVSPGAGAAPKELRPAIPAIPAIDTKKTRTATCPKIACRTGGLRRSR
jgi:hypothetical protein